MPTSPRCLKLEHVDAETPGILYGDGHVQFEIAFECRHLALIHQRIGDFLDHAGGQTGIAQRVEFALDLDVDRRAGGQEHVRCVFFRHQLEKVADIHEAASIAVVVSYPAGATGCRLP